MDNIIYSYIPDINRIELDNHSRVYFGLNNIDETWEKVDINKKTTLFYEGNTIKKVIHKELVLFEYKLISYKYVERDVDLETNNKKTILPKTNRGKEKKITSTNILSFLPTGCEFIIIVNNKEKRTYLEARNLRNNIELPITDYRWIRTYDDFKKFIDNYIKTCKSDYFEKVERMRNLPHQTIKFGVGDIFRIELDRENYGYGLIIGKTRDIEKWEEMPKDHPFHHLMDQPILVRMYKIKTKDKDLKARDLEKYQLSSTMIYCDGDIYWGKHTIVDNKILNEDDIDIPIVCTRKSPNCYEIVWGFGSIEIDDMAIPQKIVDDLFRGRFSHYGGGLCITIDHVEDILRSESIYDEYGDIRNPIFSEYMDRLFKMFRLNNNISFDEFNKKYNGLTRKQYVNRLYKKM